MYKIGLYNLLNQTGTMTNINQDCVIRLKLELKDAQYELVIPNNSLTVNAIEALTVYQQVLLEHLKPKQENQEEVNDSCAIIEHEEVKEEI